jgi:hypothetical protein
MRGFWGIMTAALRWPFAERSNAAQAPAPTPNLPQVPEVYKFVSDGRNLCPTVVHGDGHRFVCRPGRQYLGC